MTTEQPVLVNGSAAAVGAALVPVLVDLGVQGDGAAKIGSFVGSFLALILVGWHLYSARSKVTPLVNPKDNDGNALISVVQAAVEHATANAEAPAPAAVSPAAAADELPVEAG